MRRRNEASRWLALMSLLGVGCKEPAATSATPGRTQTAAVVRDDGAPSSTSPAVGPTTSPADASKPGLEYERLTLGGAAPNAELPWLVAFHGLGDTPRGFAQLFEGLPLQVHVYLVRAPINYGSGFDWFGERVTGDQERLALAIQRRVEEVSALIDTLAQQPQNRGDAVVTGFSQGGVLSLAIAAAGLRRVRAALPLAGWLPPSLSGPGPSVPVYAFHGEDDHVVPYAATKVMLASWKQPGRVVEYHTYPGVAHTITVPMHQQWSKLLQTLQR